MPRPRNQDAREELSEAIKATARQQMAAQVTAGLSLRAIARDLGMTAPAIYHYFPRLEDLITALVVDAFNGLADTMETAAAQLDGIAAIKAAALAYRQWAVDHRADFQLIYGNPIPGYEAPADITIPLARRPFDLLGRLLAQSGQVPQPLTIPPSIQQHMLAWLGSAEPVALAYWIVIAWSRIHGMVMLEIFDHSPPVVGDPAAFYSAGVDQLFEQMGLISR